MNEQEKQEKLATYVSRVKQIPTLPKMVMKILEMTNDPNVNVEAVADVILKDQVLTARIIKLVNSAFWGIRREVTSVRDAIVFLGLYQIKNIVITVSLFNAMPSNNPRFRMTALWEHGMGCGLISRIIANKVGYDDLEKAYLGGLLHDIGEVILSQYFPDEFQKVLDQVDHHNLSFYDAEEKVIGITHTDFGKWFLDQWGFSEELAEVIALHHAPERAILDTKLVSIVYLANMFSNIRGLDYGHPHTFKIAFQDEFAWKLLAKDNSNLANIDLERFTFNLDGMIDDVKTVVKEFYREH